MYMINFLVDAGSMIDMPWLRISLGALPGKLRKIKFKKSPGPPSNGHKRPIEIDTQAKGIGISSIDNNTHS